MNVLITGGGGFVGSHLVASQLDKGHNVRTVDLHTERLAHLADHAMLEIIVGDLTDSRLLAQLVAGVDVVYHLASAHLDVSLTDADYRRVNVTATANLLTAAQTVGVGRFVHCSSNGVLGEIAQPPADETTPCHPTNIYERTKLEGERTVLALGAETGLPVIVIRPAWVYGPGCPRTAKLIRTVRKGRFVMIGNGQTLRHPIYVADAIAGLELAAQAVVGVGQVYFIAGGAPVTLEQLVATIAQVCNVSLTTIRLPVALGKLAGYTCQALFGLVGQSPPISRRSVDFFLKDNAYDFGKAQHDLDFYPEVSLQDGLQRTVAALG